MENWILPFIITVIYTIFTIVIGILPGRKMDMTQHKNWGVAGATMGPLMLFFMLGGSQISAYTFMGCPRHGLVERREHSLRQRIPGADADGWLSHHPQALSAFLEKAIF